MGTGFYCYIIECADKTLYTGYTNDLVKRLEKHNSGKGAKYTRGRRPCKLVYYECYPTKSDAMRREYAIKQLSRKQKLRLIEGGYPMDDESIILIQNKDGTWGIKPKPYMTVEIATEEAWNKLQEIIHFWNENHPDDKVIERDKDHV